MRGEKLITIAIAIIMIVFFVGAKKPRQKSISCREATANECFNWILAEGAAARARHETITWDDLEVRVAVKMKVRRIKPWLGQ